MSTLLIIAVVLAVLHFLVDGIIAPTWRLALRNRLFCLRDELRALKVEGVEAADDAAFWYVHDGINTFLDRLPLFTVVSRAAVQTAYKGDSELRARVDARLKMLKECKDARITSIFARATLVVEDAFIVNSGGWFIYLVPFAICGFTVGGLRRLASRLLLTPEPDAKRLLPSIAEPAVVPY